MAFMCLCGKSYQQKHTLKSHQEKCSMHQEIIASQLADEQYHTSQKYVDVQKKLFCINFKATIMRILHIFEGHKNA